MPTSRRRLVTLGVLGGSFLAAVEATVVSTAMPTVVGQLGGLSHYSWVFSGYILTSTITMPLWGKLSDLYGRRAFYLASIGLFLLGSALSGAAQSMGQLILFRAIQGIGAGGMLPLGMTILAEIYTVAERGRVQGVFSAVWGLASIVGPLVGGYVTDALSWRWVFYLNLPFGAVTAALVTSAYVDDRRSHRPQVDYAGAILLMTGVAALMLALGQTGAHDAVLSAGPVVGLYALAAVMTALFIRVERRAAEPMLPLAMLSDRLIAIVTIVGFLVGVAMFGALSFVPLFVQEVLGGSARQAGMSLTPLLLGWVMMSIVTGRLLPRVGYRRMIVSGLVLITVGFGGLVVVRASAPAMLYVDLGLMGLGMGMTMLSLLLAMQNAVPRERLGVATSLGQFTRSIGGAVGVSAMGAIVAASLPAAGPVSALSLEQALHRAFLAAAVAAGAALAVAFAIPSSAVIQTPVPSRSEPEPTRG